MQETDEDALDRVADAATTGTADDGSHRRSLRRLLAPLGGVAASVGRLLHPGSGNANPLQHDVTNALGHKATQLIGREPAGTLGHEAANAVGHEVVNAGVADSAAAASAPPPQGQGPSAQSVGIGAAVAAAVVAVIAALAISGGDDPVPEVAQEPEPAPTTAAPVVEQPTAGPGLFVTSDSELVVGNVLEGADIGTSESPLVVVGIEGSSDHVGQPVVLPSGATVTIEADGTFRYDPTGAFESLDIGEAGTDQVTFTVSNGTDWSEEWTVEVSVEGTNDRPQLEDVEGISVGEEATASMEISAIDPDSDSLAFTLDSSAPPFVSIAASSDSTAVLTVAPRRGDSGGYDVTIMATDDGPPSLSDTVVVTITVAAAPLVRVTDGLLALYHFDESSGSVVSDASGIEPALDLHIADAEAVRWDQRGLTVEAPTILSSEGAGTKISDAVTESNELTIEAWVSTANATQSGPARVVSLSADISTRNATLGQGDSGDAGGDFWTARLRTSTTSANGLPSLSTPPGTTAAGVPAHVVLTRTSSGTVTVYLDGEAIATATVEGDLSNWDSSYPLLLANEATGDRPWLGTLHLVAVYGKDLTPEEVDQNYTVGPHGRRSG